MKRVVWKTTACDPLSSGVPRKDRKDRSEEVAIRFGENLRRCRRLAGLSQEELGERASLHRTEIGLLEKGQRVARIDTMIRLAGAMAIPPEELVAGIFWTPGEMREGDYSFGTARRASLN
jgi:transcriptional regulator with XRE-family HTH domain